MNITTQYMTANDCFRAGKKIVPKGVMVHSTAAPGVMAEAWYNRWNKAGIAKCVHAFVDHKGVFQYLPWDHRGWHAGSGAKGTANATHIGFEICEPTGFKYGSGSSMVGYDVVAQQTYFDAAWANAVELTAMLCKQYGIQIGNVICHSEGRKLGIASNHAYVMHWFPKHGRDMDQFRAAVEACMNGEGDVTVIVPISTPIAVTLPTLRRGSMGDAVKTLQQALLAKGQKLPKYGADGDFGAETEMAVKAFQQMAGLVVDGVVGVKTWGSLLN